jgi:hypothetical protein
MLPGLGAQSNLLDLDFLPGFSCLPLALGLFVLVLAKVHQFGDRWFRVGGNFNQIQGALLGKAECFTPGQNPELLAIGVDDA